MTKLFSMKSLAFAGAAAFALTLAAAPKADAAIKEENVAVDYQKGTLIVTTGAFYNEDGEFDEDRSDVCNVIRIADGWGVYFGNGKTIKSYVMTPDSATLGETSTPAALYYDISNLLGKETNVAVADAADGKDARSRSLVKSPAPKARDIESTILSGGELKDQIYQYKIGTYGEWSKSSNEKGVTDTLKTEVERAKILGTTLYVRVANFKDSKMDSPWSKEIKIKIKAKAKAPKVAIKTANLKKAFEWNLSSKFEYRILVNGKSSAWTTGSGKTKWEAVMNNAADQGIDEIKDLDLTNTTKLTKTDIPDLVNGDAIANDITFQVRTVADTAKKKDASQITVVTLEKSKDSPTADQIKVTVTDKKKKSAAASAAAILPTTEAGYVAQYSVDNGVSWKDVKKETLIESDKMTNGISLRLVGDGKNKKNSVLPSAVTTVTIPQDGSKDSKITSKNLVKDGGKWKVKSYSDYANKIETEEAPAEN